MPRTISEIKPWWPDKIGCPENCLSCPYFSGIRYLDSENVEVDCELEDEE